LEGFLVPTRLNRDLLLGLAVYEADEFEIIPHAHNEFVLFILKDTADISIFEINFVGILFKEQVLIEGPKEQALLGSEGELHQLGRLLGGAELDYLLELGLPAELVGG